MSAWDKTERGRAYRKEWYRKNYAKERARRMACALRSRKKRRGWHLVNAARRRAKLFGLEYALDEHRDEIQARVDAGFCELSGIPFNLDGGRTFDSPSLDRIDSGRGYTYDNVRVVCDVMNRALNNFNEDDVARTMAAWLARRA